MVSRVNFAGSRQLEMERQPAGNSNVYEESKLGTYLWLASVTAWALRLLFQHQRSAVCSNDRKRPAGEKAALESTPLLGMPLYITDIQG